MSNKDRARYEKDGLVFRDGKLIPKENIDPPRIPESSSLPVFKYGMLIYPERYYTCRRCNQPVLGKDLESHLKECRGVISLPSQQA